MHLNFAQRASLEPSASPCEGKPSRGGDRSAWTAGLALLDAIDSQAISGYQPYWAVRAHLLQRLEKTPEALAAYNRAIGLTEDPAVREFLLQRRG